MARAGVTETAKISVTRTKNSKAEKPLFNQHSPPLLLLIRSENETGVERISPDSMAQLTPLRKICGESSSSGTVVL